MGGSGGEGSALHALNAHIRLADYCASRRYGGRLFARLAATAPAASA